MSKLSTLQSRLAMKQDSLKRKIIDKSNLLLVSNPIDSIRIRKRTDYRGDEKTWICEKVDIIPVVFPALTDVPFVKINQDKDFNCEWKLTSLVDSFEDSEHEKLYVAQVAWDSDVNVGDLIFRIFLDENQKVNAIIPMEVVNLKGDFGGMKLIMQKCECRIPVEPIPKEIVKVIKTMSERRSMIMY